MKEIKIINGARHILHHTKKYSEKEMITRSKVFYNEMNSRRSIREFSSQPVPKELIENIIKTASTAPSGANKQPWIFCAVSDPEIKSRIRVAAEAEEKESYENRMNEEWLKDLKHFGTNVQKPFLEEAPWLIVVFKKIFDYDKDGTKLQNYYVNESVGLASGMLITAIHHAGLATLTHTPSPMKFLSEILKRPDNERPFLLLPVGHAKEPAYVPDIKRKKIKDIVVFY
jgi:nitroreductase